MIAIFDCNLLQLIVPIQTDYPLMLHAVDSLKLLPRNFPVRVCSVQNWGDFAVPRHIIRIECRTGLAKESHGWQVRYRGTKFFSDWLRGDKDSTPATALELAVRYLAERYDGQSAPLREAEYGRKAEKTGMSGLRIVRYLNRRDFEEVYVEIAHPLKGRAPRRIYVGTCNTATQQRLDAALERGRRLREQLSMEHLEQRREESLRGGAFLSPHIGGARPLSSLEGAALRV